MKSLKQYPVWMVGSLALAFTPLTGAAEGSMDVTLRMIVPETCQVIPLTAPYVSGDEIRIDELREICNSVGYRLFLEYTPGTLNGARAVFDGNAVELDGSGETLLFSTNLPVSRQSQLRIESVQPADQSTRIGLRMIPG